MPKPFYRPEPHILGWLRAFALPTDTVLDVGSGDGRYQDIGVARVKSLDIWPAAKPDYLRDLERDNLPRGRFSLILLMDVLEHLSKPRGLEILSQAVSLSRRAVVVLTPLDWEENREPYEDQAGFYYHNEAVLHRSLWDLADFGPDWTRVWLPTTKRSFFGYWARR